MAVDLDPGLVGEIDRLGAVEAAARLCSTLWCILPLCCILRINIQLKQLITATPHATESTQQLQARTRQSKRPLTAAHPPGVVAAVVRARERDDKLARLVHRARDADAFRLRARQCRKPKS